MLIKKKEKKRKNRKYRKDKEQDNDLTNLKTNTNLKKRPNSVLLFGFGTSIATYTTSPCIQFAKIHRIVLTFNVEESCAGDT